MSDEIKRVADWEPGTLDKTRKNIGNIDSEEAAIMAKKALRPSATKRVF